MNVDDSTDINGVTWATLKTTAMASGYSSTSAYTALSQANKGLVDFLISTQTNVSLPALPAAPYTTGKAYTDATVIASTTWASLKSVAMSNGYSTAALSTSD